MKVLNNDLILCAGGTCEVVGEKKQLKNKISNIFSFIEIYNDIKIAAG